MSNQAIYNFPEEKIPAGSSQFETLLRKIPQGILVNRVKTHPWWIVIWEPLTTKVPSPNTVQPYCCYIKTVIFYHRPYIVRQNGYPFRIGNRWCFQKPGRQFVKYDQLEHTFTFDDAIFFENETFMVSSAGVRWKNKQWYMCYTAKRVKNKKSN